MATEIIVAIITGIVTLAGVIITTVVSNNKTASTIDKNQAVMEERMRNLTDEVKRHNEFAERIPELKTRLDMLEKQLNEVKGK